MNKIRGVESNTITEVVKRLSFFVLFVLFLIVLFTYSTFSARADIATILPEIYSMSGSPLLGENDTTTPYTQYEYVWNNFQNDIVGGSAVQNITLKFTWSFADREVPDIQGDNGTERVDSVSSTSADETDVQIESGSTDASHSPDVTTEDIHDTSPIDTLEAVSAIEALLKIIDIVPTPTPPLEETSPTQTVDNPEFQVLLRPSGTFKLALAELEEQVLSPSHDSGIEGEIHEPENILPISNTEVVEPEDAVSSTESIESGDAVSSTESIEPEEVVSTGEHVAPVVDNSTTQAVFDTSVFQVLYSLDGQEWNLLGERDFANPGDVVFALPQLSIESIHDLRIMVRYIQRTDTVRKMYFDNVHIDVDVIPLEPLPENPKTYSENEPNFDSSAIKADVQTDTIRVVLLERGGMLELWYGRLDDNAQDIAWTKLLNDGSIDESSPIAIKGTTIFWLDKNQQTLFGFDIEKQSIFGEPIDASDDVDAQLTFEDEHAKQWNAVLDIDTKSFEFTKSPQPK